MYFGGEGWVEVEMVVGGSRAQRRREEAAWRR
jgi:hypothetical protein